MTETSNEARDEGDAEPLAALPLVLTVELAVLPASLREVDGLLGGETMVTGVEADAPATLRVNGREVARVELGQVDGKLALRLLRKPSGGAG